MIENLKLDTEKERISQLILAREFYYQENYFKGDEYLKVVEKSKNKSKLIESLLEEVSRNKKFYENRDDDHKPLVLRPTNKKFIRKR